MGKEYNIAKVSAQCRRCGAALAPGQEFTAALREAGEDFAREDYCLACGESLSADQPEVVGVWRSKVPQPQEKRKLFVDDEVLLNFFERLADIAEEAKVGFRFVLTLILMRKRILVYEGMAKLPDGRERWTMRLRGGDRTYEVINPRLEEDKIAEISQHLGDILQGEL